MMAVALNSTELQPQVDPVLSKVSFARLIDAIFVSACVILCGVTAWIGAVHTYRYGHDIIVMLDGAWRVLNGQRPSVDFSTSGFGPVPFLLYAAGLKLAHCGVQGFGYAVALLGFIVGLWSYRIGIARMSRVLAALASLYLVLLVLAPYPVGFRYWLSHAMAYNRQGYAFLGIIMLEALQGVPGDSRREWLIGGVSTGAAGAILLFLKASFGLVGVGFAVVSLFFFGPVRTRVAGMLAGAAVVSLPVLAYLRFDIADMLRDLSVAAGARAGGVGSWSLKWNTWDHLPEALPLLFLAALLTQRSSKLTVAIRPLVFFLMVFCAGVLLLTTNAQTSGFPLSGVLAIILAAAVPRSQLAVLALAFAAFLPQLMSDGTGLLRAAIQARRVPAPGTVTRFNSPVLSKLLLFDLEDPLDWERRSNGNIYVSTLNEGFDLVRRYSRPTETVRDMDAFDPFSYALQRKPARGGAIALSYANSFDDTHKHSAEWLYGAADVLLVPLYPSAPIGAHEAILRNYESAALAGRKLCAESEHWKLYKRANNLQGCPQ